MHLAQLLKGGEKIEPFFSMESKSRVVEMNCL